MSDKRKRLLGDDEIAAILERESDSEDEGGAIEESSDSDAVEENSTATPSTSTGLTRPITWKRVRHRECNVYADYKKVKDFSGNPSVTGFGGLSPFKCFEKFFPDDIYDLVIEETNRYAGQKLQSIGQLSNRSIFRKWKDLPKEISIKLKRDDAPIIWENEGKSLIVSTMQDTGRVNMISTVGNVGMSNVEGRSKKGVKNTMKPIIQQSYNKFMGGVDMFDQLCSTYPFGRKSMKGYQVLWHFIIEVALVNGRICYNIQNPAKKRSQKQYRESVINGLLTNYARSSSQVRMNRTLDPTLNRLHQRHFAAQLKDKKQFPNCVVCSILPSKCQMKKKGQCKRKQTTYYCPDCLDKPTMGVDSCFRIYHTAVKFRKVCDCT